MLTFRLCTEKDLETLCDLSRRTFLSAFKHLNSAENMQAYLDKAYCPEQLLRELNNPYSAFYFAIDDETPIGYIKVNEALAQTDIHDEASLELERIYLLREFRGLGLGKELLEKAVSIGNLKKKRYVWLGVWDKNEKAIAFYQKNGFEIVGEHPFVMGNDRQNDFIMKRELPNNQNTPALKGEKTMGKATADLRKEHDAILFVLKLLEKMTTTTEADKQAMLKTYGEVLYFLKIFVDKCHHGKEEVYLFKELVELGITEEGGPIGAMLKEHAEGRVLIAEMSDGLDAANKDSFDRAAAGYRNLLLRHIEKENTVLFEMADHLMDEPEQDAMFSKFEQFEEQVMGHGIHEQLHAMIDTWAEAFEVK